MPWTFEVATDIGSRSEQQDRVEIFHSKDGQRHLVVLADGMGGLKNGAQAAQILLDVAAQHFADQREVSAYTFLQNICLAAHQAIIDLKQATGSAIGTTAVLLYIDNRRAIWAHIGDSRLYHFRDSNLSSCTNDHSLQKLMTDDGQVDKDSTEANAMQNQLYMCLGSEQLPEPDFNSADVQDGDLFLLCSDGLWQTVQTSEMNTSREHNGVRSLVNLAKQRNGDRCDNISLTVAQWQDSIAQKYWYRFINFLR